MQWLSQKKEDILDQYEVVIIGSGYGGAVAASLLARDGLHVCLLERGKEIVPGEYPNNINKILKEVQLDIRSGHYGPATGLFNIHCNKEMNIILGCGLGGTSLIDAGQCLRPNPQVFQDLIWPEAIRNNNGIEKYYQKAEAMLRPSQTPILNSSLDKYNAMEQLVHEVPLTAKILRSKLAINFENFSNNLNHVGVQQNPCVYCGDFLTGCNYSAKKYTPHELST